MTKKVDELGFFKHHLRVLVSQAQWHLPVIPALRRQRQEDLYEFKTSLVYMVRYIL